MRPWRHLVVTSSAMLTTRSMATHAWFTGILALKRFSVPHQNWITQWHRIHHWMQTHNGQLRKFAPDDKACQSAACSG